MNGIREWHKSSGDIATGKNVEPHAFSSDQKLIMTLVQQLLGIQPEQTDRNAIVKIHCLIKLRQVS
jgi:hypothetical protein